jgi:hypothetical protein
MVDHRPELERHVAAIGEIQKEARIGLEIVFQYRDQLSAFDEGLEGLADRIGEAPASAMRNISRRSLVVICGRTATSKLCPPSSNSQGDGTTSGDGRQAMQRCRTRSLGCTGTPCCAS